MSLLWLFMSKLHLWSTFFSCVAEICFHTMLISNHNDNFKLNIYDYQFNHHAAWLNVSWMSRKQLTTHTACMLNLRLMFGKALNVSTQTLFWSPTASPGPGTGRTLTSTKIPKSPWSLIQERWWSTSAEERRPTPTRACISAPPTTSSAPPSPTTSSSASPVRQLSANHIAAFSSLTFLV